MSKVIQYYEWWLVVLASYDDVYYEVWDSVFVGEENVGDEDLEGDKL